MNTSTENKEIKKAHMGQKPVPATRMMLVRLLADTRRKQGLSQEKLAEKIGVERGTVQKIETGRWNIGVDTLFRFLDGLELLAAFTPKTAAREPGFSYLEKEEEPQPQNG